MHSKLKHISLLLSWLILLSFLPYEAASLPDSLAIGENQKDYQGAISSYIQAGKEEFDEQKYDEALIFFQKAYEQSFQYQLSAKNQILYKHLGITYYRLQDFEKTIQYLDKFLINNPDVSQVELSETHHTLSLSYRHLGDLFSAFEHELINLEIVEHLGDPVKIWKANYQLGNILVFQDDYIGALDYYRTTELISKEIPKKPRYLYSSLGALGNVYHKMDSLDLAMDFNTKALNLAEEINYIVGIAYSHHNIGNDLLELDQIEASLKHHLQSLKIKEEIKDRWGIASSYRMMGSAYTAQRKYQLAEETLKEAERVSIELNAKPLLAEVYEVFSELYMAKGDFEIANTYLRQYIETKDDIRRENAMKKVKSKKMAYEIKKRDNEIETLKLDQEIQANKAKTVNYILLAITPFIILLGMALIHTRKVNRLIVEKGELINQQNEALEKSNDALENSNNALEESNKELEQFVYVASHDMREPIRTIRSFNSLLRRRFGETIGERGMEFVNFIEDASSRMDLMLTDLLDYSRVNTKDKNKTIVNLALPAELAAKNLSSKISTEGVIVDISKLPEVKANPVQMERLFQNLIANGIKYNNKDEKTIKIDYKKNGKGYIISVHDNGIGIPEEHQDKVFEIFRRLHGTADYEGSGIGLATCKKIVERHQGEIWIDSQPEEGTTVYFSIPFTEAA